MIATYPTAFQQFLIRLRCGTDPCPDRTHEHVVDHDPTG